MRTIILICFISVFHSCDRSTFTPDLPDPESGNYFPESDSEYWETNLPENLGWNVAANEELFSFLADNRTRAFILLHKGRIVMEKYWGKKLLQNDDFDQYSLWYWASAGKTITAFLTGIAQEQGILNINDKTSNYLGKHWTSMPVENENQICIKHHLSMTTGLDYTSEDNSCFSPGCLKYKADPGLQWFYHNAPYTLLGKIISEASGKTYNEFTEQQLKSKIGMDGQWITNNNNVVYWSSPRSAARFGLLILNKGKWGAQQIMTDMKYFTAMTTPSQKLNPSYGYLFWLNGQSSIIFPGQSKSFDRSLAPDAPDDMFTAFGKNGQFIDIVPSKDLVVVRMGETPIHSVSPIIFHNIMWKMLSEVMDL